MSSITNSLQHITVLHKSLQSRTLLIQPSWPWTHQEPGQSLPFITLSAATSPCALSWTQASNAFFLHPSMQCYMLLIFLHALPIACYKYPTPSYPTHLVNPHWPFTTQIISHFCACNHWTNAHWPTRTGMYGDWNSLKPFSSSLLSLLCETTNF